MLPTADQGKPAPDMILKACDLAGVLPEETVYVGDQRTDAQAGSRAGVGGTELLDAGADVIVDSMS